MSPPLDPAARQAVYESCLDASFARTGACVGLIVSAQADAWTGVATSSRDHLANSDSEKARNLSRMVGGRRFQELDRRLRQELLSMDGAILIGHTGSVHAVGAILQIPGGSIGGGRLAAARALAPLGVGIKVSQDGGILGFRGNRPTPSFYVM